MDQARLRFLSGQRAAGQARATYDQARMVRTPISDDRTDVDPHHGGQGRVGQVHAGQGQRVARAMATRRRSRRWPARDDRIAGERVVAGLGQPEADVQQAEQADERREGGVDQRRGDEPLEVRGRGRELLKNWTGASLRWQRKNVTEAKTSVPNRSVLARRPASGWRRSRAPGIRMAQTGGIGHDRMNGKIAGRVGHAAWTPADEEQDRPRLGRATARTPDEQAGSEGSASPSLGTPPGRRDRSACWRSVEPRVVGIGRRRARGVVHVRTVGPVGRHVKPTRRPGGNRARAHRDARA